MGGPCRCFGQARFQFSKQIFEESFHIYSFKAILYAEMRRIVLLWEIVIYTVLVGQVCFECLK